MSASAPKVTFLSKVAPKRKGIGKDDRPANMVMSQSTRVNQEDQLQKSPSPPCHDAGKGLMSTHGPV